MKRYTLVTGALLLASMFMGQARAQLSTNPDKFLGNITTRGQVNGGGYEYKTKWNQLTCENETKWSSVQGGGPNSWNWGGADNAYNYCKSNGLLFKFHCLAWGSQYPSWIEKLTPEERYQAIVNWMDAVKKRYPDLKMFDVVNEAVEGHQAGTHFFAEALGGAGVSGWDWIIKAFELAHERWPDAILIYNDFNTFQWQRSQFISLCKALRDYGAPIDAYGCQSHDLTGYGLTNFRQAVDEIQNNLKMPMYSTEYDIGTDDDNQQLTNYKEQIPYMWEKDYFAGLTLWGSTYGATWTTNGNSGILNKNGKNRPAYDWLVEYMKSDKAKTAKSPFPGMKKQVDLYIKPMQPKFSMGEPGQIDLRARMIDKTRKIARIDFYANNQLYCTLTEAPWVVEYTPGKMGSIPLRAVLVAEDGAEYVRYGNVNVVSARAPYGTYYMPGTLQCENFDKGVEGSAFHDIDFTNTGNNSYRTDVGVDISTGNGGKVVSETVTGEWMEYTINVREEGIYSYELTGSSGVEDAAVSLAVKTDDGYVNITEPIAIPMAKKGYWSKYNTVYGRTTVPLTAGKHIIRMNVDRGGAYLDKFVFKKVNLNEQLAVDLSLSTDYVYEKDTVLINALPVTPGSEAKTVTVYVDNVKQKTFSGEPYTFEYVPTQYGKSQVMAFVTDTADCVSPLFTTTLMVDKRRIPFKTVPVIPGDDIEAENFDIMGEGFSFHDSDETDEGKTGYRADNEGVDIIKISDGYAIGKTAANEWLDYTVDVQEEGIYDIRLSVSSGSETGQYQLFRVDRDGTETAISAKKTIAAYKNESTYRFTAKTYLSEALKVGRQVIRVKFLKPFNLDKFSLTINEERTAAYLETGVEQVALSAGTFTVYSTDGVNMGNITVTDVTNLGDAVRALTHRAGIYVVKNASTGESRTIAVSE